MMNIKYKSGKGDSFPQWHDHSFVISVICFIIGALIRIAYCIQYPVQPRDSYKYILLITQWEETGEISDTVFFPLCLWILRIPFHFFHYDCMKGGIIVNLILGMLMIIIVVNTTKQFFRNNMIILFAGLIVATHPSLVSFSCVCLRENNYLFFSMLGLIYLVQYYRRIQCSYLLLVGLFGAFASLCRLEGVEILPVVYFSILFMFIFKKIRLSKAILHGLLFSVTFVATVVSLYYCFDFKFFSQNIIMTKFIWTH